MANSDVSVKFSADIGTFTSAMTSAAASARSATADMRASATGAGAEFARLNATLGQLAEATKRGADAAESLESFKNAAAAVGLLAAALYGIKSATEAAASGVSGLETATHEALSGAGSAITGAIASWRAYAKSVAYVQRYLPLVQVENDGIVASIGRVSIAFGTWLRSAEIYKSGLLDVEGAAIAATGTMAKVAAAARDMGFDNATRLLQAYTTELTRIPGMTNEAAAAIQAGFAAIPNYSGALNTALIDVTVALSTTGAEAKTLGDQLVHAMTDPAASGQQFLHSLGGVTAALLEQFATAQRTQNVGQMQAVIIDALIAKERLLGAEKTRSLQEQLQAYDQLGALGRLLSGAIGGQVQEAVKFQDALDAQLATLRAQGQSIRTMVPDLEQLRRSMMDIVAASHPLSAQIDAVNGKIGILQQGLQASTSDAATLIRQFEGFRNTAVWDKNAWRVGYGSDTTTDASGTVAAVTQSTTTTQEDAQRDLARRVVEFQQEAATEIGAAWASLSDKAKASITSLAYNYGHVPDSVGAAAQSGNDHEIAEAIRALSANPGRRAEEANNITAPTLSGTSDPQIIEQANQALAQQKDELQQIQDTKAGGNAVDQATLANLQRMIDGKKDDIADAQAIVAAAQKQLDVATSAETKAKAEQALLQARIGLQDRLNEANKAELALDVARATTPAEIRDAKVAAAAFQMSLYAKDTAAYKQALAEQEAAETAFASNAQKDDAASEDATYQRALQGLEQRKDLLREEAQNAQIGNQQLLTGDLQIEDQRTALEKAHFAKLKAIWDEGSTEYRKASQQLEQVDATAAARRQQIMTQDSQKIGNEYKQMFASIGASVTSSLMGMLQGTTSFAGLMRNVALSIVEMFLKAGVDMVVNWAAAQAAALAKTLAMQAAQTGAVVAGAAARTSAQNASSAASMVSTATAVITSIGASAAETFAGIFGFLSPVMGPAAAGPAAAGQATVAAAAGSVPSFAIGAWSLPSDMLAQVHQGEMIVPAGPAAALRGAFSSGSASTPTSMTFNHATNLNIQAVDASGVSEFFRNNAKPLMRALNEAVQKGAHLGFAKFRTA